MRHLTDGGESSPAIKRARGSPSAGCSLVPKPPQSSICLLCWYLASLPRCHAKSSAPLRRCTSVLGDYLI
jgi:hypothetical protein